MKKATGLPYHLRQRRQLRALVPPARQQIVDGVAAIGPCTVAALARLVGRKPTALYHHLARLEAVGLLVRAPSAAATRGRPRALYDVPGRPVLLDMAALTQSARPSVRKYVGAMLRNSARAYSAALAAPRLVHAGPRRNLWAASWKGWLSRADVERAGVLLHGLIDLLQRGTAHGPRGRRLMELTFVFSPTVSSAAMMNARR